MSKRLLKKLAIVGSALPLAIVSQSSHAAVDVTAITAAVAEAATGLTSVQMAFISLSTGILALAMVYAFIRRRAGA
ncbi:MAG: hypothetical protein Q7T66_10370 [Herminiimonas sp.]|uniref:hypothetical protein n=1 Tax=Herminiimonas sp. TaxID=1926289 RepID=UPI0027223F2A|nr:hypothetical protein [Herminiimonas sp.]MDO9421057.1 hypothetical protein [Herminiimonas sp.]